MQQPANWQRKGEDGMAQKKNQLLCARDVNNVEEECRNEPEWRYLKCMQNVLRECSEYNLNAHKLRDMCKKIVIVTSFLLLAGSSRLCRLHSCEAAIAELELRVKLKELKVDSFSHEDFTWSACCWPESSMEQFPLVSFFCAVHRVES